MADLIDRVWQQVGGRGTQPEVTAHVIASRPDHLTSYLADRGTAQAVSGYLRRQEKGSDLPAAPAVDEHGTHVQLELMNVDEFRYVYEQYRKRGRANNQMAKRINDRCHDVHGVWVEPGDAASGAA